jgi:hypothetical protein
MSLKDTTAIGLSDLREYYFYYSIALYQALRV